MSTLQQQARALGDPTRHAIFRYVVDHGEGVAVDELTSRFGFNHNAIRQHLAKLAEAGLVVGSTARSAGRGRPKLIYRVAPSADGRWDVVGPYERLAGLLAEIVRTGDDPADVGRRAVGRIAATTDDPVDALVTHMARSGFDPAVRRRGDRVEVVLRTCPFASAALVDPDTVCAVHLGLAQGVADGVGGLVVDELVRHDPRRANCRLRCHVARSSP